MSQRRQSRRERVTGAFEESEVEAALDALELVDLAWHDCYGEMSPPERVVDDIFVVGRGRLSEFVAAGRLAVTDRRDLSLVADDLRSSS